MGERGKARAFGQLDMGDQRLDQGRRGRRAEQHRLLASARVQQTIGEDMPAFAVGCELYLVDRHEGMASAIMRHGLCRTQEIARIFRLNAFLASDQRNRLFALDGDDAIVNLARQKPQREAHRAARVAAHPLYGEVSLAGVGGAKDSLDRRRGHAPHVARLRAHRKRTTGLALAGLAPPKIPRGYPA